jgi:methionine synthase II (cobalamin-independent)
VTATGIGSLPGEDIDAAVAQVFEALPELPHLPELPARGPGADMVGRSASALEDLHVDLQPAGWRLVARAGMDERRAASLLERDLDALVPVAAGYTGPFKVQLAGPWTLAATVELPRGGKVLGDRGAVRDLVDSLAETAGRHLDDVRRRLPGADLVLQLDEPALPATLAGAVPTASGLGRIAATDPVAAAGALRRVVDAAAVPVVVHCCASRVPLGLLRDAGVTAVSVDLAVADLDLDDVGEQIERGLGLWLGVVPSTAPTAEPQVRDVAAPVRALWGRLGFPAEQLPATVTVMPACGLAGASAGWAAAAMRLVQEASRVLAEAPEGVRT